MYFLYDMRTDSHCWRVAIGYRKQATETTPELYSFTEGFFGIEIAKASRELLLLGVAFDIYMHGPVCFRT
jgi:hypothetical protein